MPSPELQQNFQAHENWRRTRDCQAHSDSKKVTRQREEEGAEKHKRSPPPRGLILEEEEEEEVIQKWTWGMAMPYMSDPALEPLRNP